MAKNLKQPALWNPGRDRSDRWRRGEYSREELSQALLAAKVAGPVTSHDRGNVRWKLHRLVDGDPGLQFGIQGLQGYTFDQVLELMGRAAGFAFDPLLRDDPVPIDPGLILDACEAAGRRLALAAERGEQVILATGHPAGLPLLYMAVGDLLVSNGAKLLRPMESERWRQDGQTREVRYLHGVGMLTNHGSSLHTHDPEAMELMLAESRPDLAFADHGFAGAAIQAGVETISIVDINDPAPVVARAQGRTELVIVLDDNVLPEDYWPCFQAIAAQFP